MGGRGLTAARPAEPGKVPGAGGAGKGPRSKRQPVAVAPRGTAGHRGHRAGLPPPPRPTSTASAEGKPGCERLGVPRSSQHSCMDVFDPATRLKFPIFPGKRGQQAVFRRYLPAAPSTNLGEP